MNAKTANRLAKIINQTTGYRVVGTRWYWDTDDYALDVIITATGDPILVNSFDEWRLIITGWERAYRFYAAEGAAV